MKKEMFTATKGAQQANTPQHKSTWNYTYSNTLPPLLTLPAACTKLPTTFSVGLELQKRRFQKKQKKMQKHGVAVFRQTHVSTRGGGGCVHTERGNCCDRKEDP